MTAVCYALLVHRYPEQVARLVNRLDGPGVTFRVHVDAKADITPFYTALRGRDSVRLLHDRTDVRWGAYSTVTAMLDLMRSASTTAASHVVLLSGQDYPLQPTRAIQDFFSAHHGRNFLSWVSLPDPDWPVMSRIERYHLADSPRLDAVLRRVRHRLPVRQFPSGFTPFGGSQWWALTPDAIDAILKTASDRRDLMRFFRLSLLPDEMAIHTLLMNSPFADTVINDDVRYIDWTTGGNSPPVFTLADTARLLAKPDLFARKFDATVDSAILDALDARARANNRLAVGVR